jgi:hypothetical protein
MGSLRMRRKNAMEFTFLVHLQCNAAAGGSQAIRCQSSCLRKEAAAIRRAFSPSYYRVGYAQGRLEIFRETDGHVFCVCRSKTEAEQLTRTLIQNYANGYLRHCIK